MRIRGLHPFSHIHEPLRMDFAAWLAILVGTLLGLLFHPEFHW